MRRKSNDSNSSGFSEPQIPSLQSSMSRQTSAPSLIHQIPRRKLHYIWIPFIFAIGVLLYNLGMLAFYNLPKPLTKTDEIQILNTSSTSSIFIGENAHKNLNELVKIGPKVVGSPQNEHVAIKFLVERIIEIQNKLKNNGAAHHSIEIDVQVASGNYSIWEMINAYQGVQNIVVKLSPIKPSSKYSILLNSHFDTVPGSPGGGDDGTMVVVMLEVLRVLAISRNPLKHSVIFLFNGAEENPLQGSHAFITQHKWAKDIQAFINLDSAGNGGKEILFQAGPQHSWLLQYYKDYAIHPYGQTIAEELFQKKLIPSDTDFRIFRDYGNIPGLDMAHSYNGYVYHTKFDDIDTIQVATLQNTGDNLLAITAALANAEEIEDTKSYNSGQHTVFYDLFGLYLISYKEQTGFALNMIISIYAIVFIVFISTPNMKQTIIAIHPVRNVFKHFRITFGIQLLSLIIGISLCILIAFILDKFNFTLLWFSNTWLIFGLYFCPLFFIWTLIPILYFKYYPKKNLGLGNRIQLFLHSQCLILALLNIGLSWGFNIRSTYILTFSILCYILPVTINYLVKLQNKPHYWLILHFIFQMISFTYFSYLTHSIITTFVPMTGRGAALFNNPEYLICIIAITFGMLLVGFVLPAFNNFEKSQYAAFLFLLLSIVIFIIAFTPIGFPYRPKVSIQRHIVFHTKRVFHNKDFSINRTDFGYYILPMDKRSLTLMQNNLANVTILSATEEQCRNEINCGLPFNIRTKKLKNISFWSPTDNEPNLIIEPKLQLIAKHSIDMNTTRFNLKLTGPDHISILIQPETEKGIKLIEWSFMANTPKLRNWSSPYFIYFSYGLDSSPLQFYLDFEHPPHYSDTIFGIAVVGHLNHHDSYQTEEFKKFLNLFPNWTYPQAWMASYHSWKF